MVIQHEETVINLGHVLYGVRFRGAVLLSSSPSSPLAPLLCAPLLSASPSRHGDSRSVMQFVEKTASALGAFRPNFGHIRTGEAEFKRVNVRTRMRREAWTDEGFTSFYAIAYHRPTENVR